MPRKKGYDQGTDLAQLKYRLRELAEKFRDEHPDFIEEGEILHVEAWIEKAKDDSDATLYNQPKALELTRSRPFTPLHPALITYGELRTFKYALERAKDPKAYQYLEKLLLHYKNQPTHADTLLRKAFGLAAIVNLPSSLKNPEDTIRHFKEFFRGIDRPDLMLLIANRRVQLWEIKR